MTRRISDWGGNIVALTLVIVVNVLANAVPLGGRTTGEVAARYPSLFTPAGYVFSIWGLIYLLLTLFVVWQALPNQRTSQTLGAARLGFLASCAGNATWIFLWHYDFVLLSMLCMLVILGAVLHVYRALRIGTSDVAATERWLAHLPFSVYLGWITVASIANLSVVQLYLGWDDVWLEASAWTVLQIVLAATVAVTVLFRRRDVAFMLVVVWATAGIAARDSTIAGVGGAALAVSILGMALIPAEYLSRGLTVGRSNTR